MANEETYRGYTFSYWRKPIPTAAFDYDFVHEDYDGAPDGGDNRCGSGRSIEDCKAQIDEIELDNAECRGWNVAPTCDNGTDKVPADCGGDLEYCQDGLFRCDVHADHFHYEAGFKA